jgi:hypothetical protein
MEKPYWPKPKWVIRVATISREEGKIPIFYNIPVEGVEGIDEYADEPGSKC